MKMRMFNGFGMDAKKGLIIVLAMVLLSAHPAFAVPAKPGVVSGYVLDAANGAPIEGATVTATCTSGETYSKLTSSRGKYFMKIKNVPTDCEVSVQADGYQVPESETLAIESGFFSHADFTLDLESGPVDTEAPTIEIEGVDEGAYYDHDVSATVTITDESQYTSTITLDDDPYTSGDTISSEDGHVLTVVATDEFGNSASETVAFTVDKTAPGIEIEGVEDGGYYNTGVSATVTVTDDNLESSSITLDGSAYDGALIETEGEHVLEVTATDMAGNTNSKTVTFTIDMTPPSITISSPESRDYLHTERFIIAFSVEDGVSAVATLDGEEVDNGAKLDLFQMELGSHTFEVTATDAAGNVEIVSVDFNVIATIDSLKSAVERFHNDEQIESRGIYNSLVSKLNAAERKLDSGNEKAANNILNAFISHVEAQRGKRISEEAADALIAEASAIL